MSSSLMVSAPRPSLDSIAHIPGALFCPTELQIGPTTTRAEYERLGKALAALETADDLWMCDFTLWGLTRFGRDEGLAIACAATKMSKHYLGRCARIAQVFTPDRRRPELNKTHYMKLLAFDQEKIDGWLPTVDLKNVSARSLYLLAVDAFGKPDPKTQSPQGKSVWVREDLWARLAPHAPSRKISTLVELILEHWLASPQTEQEIITADLEQRRVKHNANQVRCNHRNAKKKEPKEEKIVEPADVQFQLAKFEKKTAGHVCRTPC